jgi:hypothetical protein
MHKANTIPSMRIAPDIMSRSDCMVKPLGVLGGKLLICCAPPTHGAEIS